VTQRALVIVLLLASALPAHALELRLLMAWDQRYPGVKHLAERYARKVAEASANEVTFNLTGPEAIPAFEQLPAVELGIFDLLLTHGAFHIDAQPLSLALDAVAAEPEILRGTGVWEVIDRAYQARGLKLLALPVAATGYQLYLREPLGPDCDLNGRVIRAAPSYAQVIALLGARSLALPIGEVHAALADLRLDGVAWSSVGSLPYRWYEVSRYLMRPTFGSVTHVLLMHRATWEQMPLDLQQMLLEQGLKLETKAYKRFKKVATAEQNELNVAGMQVTNLCAEKTTALARAWAEGVWRLAVERGGQSALDLRALAAEHGLTPAAAEPAEVVDGPAVRR
jgi:TRAP-type C4-dicarboxylate transport system substrate-binding protein